MSNKGLLQKSFRRSRVLRYKAYKKVGLARHRRKIDMSLLILFLLCVLSFPFLIRPKNTDIIDSDISESVEVSNEEVHGDLGDEPVIPVKQTTLEDLEKRAQMGDLTLKIQTLEPKDTLLGLLVKAGVPSEDRMNAVSALETVVNVKALKPGTTFMLFQNQQGRLMGLSAQIKEGESVGAVFEEENVWTPFTAAGRVESVSERLTGVIERTFSGSAKKAGIPDSVIAQITAALDGEVDFAIDCHAGDTFDVIFETKKTAGGLEIGTKQLLFIGLKMGNKELYRYAYTNKAGTTSYYDAKGRTGEKALLKRPVMGRARLSSPYGSRRHPILKYVIFHHGVDLAIKTGTPIQAGADGVITMLGRKGGYGKYIRIRHADGYQTAYGHMSGYRQDLKVGSKVKRGEVIGYVGNTGRSTGPHLHYEVLKNNKTVNPFGKNIIAPKQLTGFELEQFNSAAESMDADFVRHRIGKIPPVPELPPV